MELGRSCLSRFTGRGQVLVWMFAPPPPSPGVSLLQQASILEDSSAAARALIQPLLYMSYRHADTESLILRPACTTCSLYTGGRKTDLCPWRKQQYFFFYDFYDLFLFFMCMSLCLHVCRCLMCVPDAQRSQKRGYRVPWSWSYIEL